MQFLEMLSLDNVYVQHFLFAFASLFVGLLGVLLGQRVATNGKVGMVIGLGLGALAVFLLFTPYGFLSPGWVGVFLFSFLVSDQVSRLLQGPGAKKPGNNPPQAKP